MRVRALLLSVIVFLWGSMAYGDGQRPDPGQGKVFLFTAKKLGIPILKASIQIENGISVQGKSFCQVHAAIYSVNFGFSSGLIIASLQPWRQTPAPLFNT